MRPKPVGEIFSRKLVSREIEPKNASWDRAQGGANAGRSYVASQVSATDVGRKLVKVDFVLSKRHDG